MKVNVAFALTAIPALFKGQHLTAEKRRSEVKKRSLMPHQGEREKARRLRQLTAR